jgi:hypothetical protein
MVELTFTESTSEEQDYHYPSYQDKGNILVELHDTGNTGYHRWEVTVLGYDSDKAPFWLNEGLGIDYWVKDMIDDQFPHEGIWFIEDVYGYYYKGTWGFDDDDEEWYHGEIREPTAQELEDYA